MVRLLLEYAGDHIGGFVLAAIGLLISVSALVALCANHARRAPQKHDIETNYSKSVLAPKSPLASQKRLATNIIDKPITFMYEDKDVDQDNKAEIEAKEGEGRFGQGGLWQKSILMGERCQPPDFSGVIYYDNHGNQLSEMPRSPRTSPLANYKLPAIKDAN